MATTTAYQAPVLPPLSPLRTLHKNNNTSYNAFAGAVTTYSAASPVKRPRAEHAHGAAHSSIDHLGTALKSVCKVFATTANPNFATPWQMHQQHKSTASAWIVAPLAARRILTNAHAVANQVQVQVRKHGLAKKFSAKVLAVGHECDIAMLTVEEDEFWSGVEALEIAPEVPAQQESVSVVGYPTGGDNVCVTKGVVSRIDRQQYSHGCTHLLTLQIDAAINSGNSGGPVMLADKVVGIAFQCLTSGESIGYVIPVPVIQHFLDDLVRHEGRYTGFCSLGACWQFLEGAADHKAALGMPSALTGVYITSVEPCYPAAQVLRAGDVLTHFNGHAIADDGTFLFEPHHQHRHGTGSRFGSVAAEPAAPAGDALWLLSPSRHAPGVLESRAHLASPQPPSLLASPLAKALMAISSPTRSTPSLSPHVGLKQQAARIDFRHLVAMAFDGDECELGVWRDGAILMGGVRLRLTIPKQLVPVHSHDVKPHYLIFGGLVFTTLTCFYLKAMYGSNWSHKAPVKLCERALCSRMEQEGQECVIISKVLAYDVNQGYQDLGNIEVLQVAGVPVHNLAHLAHILTHIHPEPTSGPYVRLDLQWNKVVVLNVPKCREALPEILEQNCIPGAGYYPDTLMQGAPQLPDGLLEATQKALLSGMAACSL